MKTDEAEKGQLVLTTTLTPFDFEALDRIVVELNGIDWPRYTDQ